MDNTQLATIVSAIVAAGAGLAAAVRWAASRIVRALDANTEALTKQAAESAVQAETLRNVADEVRVVHEWCERHTGVHELPRGIREKPQRASTPARGVGIGQYRQVRGRTHPEEDE